jgi:hypothetical protein
MENDDITLGVMETLQSVALEDHDTRIIVGLDFGTTYSGEDSYEEAPRPVTALLTALVQELPGHCRAGPR